MKWNTTWYGLQNTEEKYLPTNNTTSFPIFKLFTKAAARQTR